MREIKFRGLKENGEGWAYGWLWMTRSNKVAVIKDLEKGADIEIIPKTIGQFTGLKDKNGKEIYEGDICKTRDSCEYKEGLFDELLICDNFNDFIYDVLYSEDHSGLWGYRRKEIEVIGNIHENKELC